MRYEQLADGVLLIHLGVVLFVVGGLLAIVAGAALRWSWIRSRTFRIVHLAAIGFVVAQAWLREICPLTTLEQWLRKRAGGATYEGSFIEHWVSRLLFFEARPWVFTLGYTVFGLLVVTAWVRFPPRRPERRGPR